MRGLYNLVRLTRPSHWIKNSFVFAALIFSRKVLDRDAVLESLIALAAFCLASSAVYTFNDILDAKQDASHPTKRRRPIAAGEIHPQWAAVFGFVLTGAALAVGWTLRTPFSAIVGAYLVIMFLYVLGLKRIAVLDVLIIALGFVLRAYGGGVAIDVWVSPWLILCTLTLALFLGFAKRESERAALGPAAGETRAVEWAAYDPKSLDHMMTVSAALAIVTYMLYTVSAETTRQVGHSLMFLTVLPVVYAIFRFYRMAISGRATGPVEMVRRDPAFVVALTVWLGIVAVLMFGWLGTGTVVR